MNGIEKLQALVEYYDSTRSIGHTKLMLHGLTGSDGAVLLSHNADYGKKLVHDADCDIHTILTIGNVEGLRGLRAPLAIDNFALRTLFIEAVSEYSKVLVENRILHWKLQNIRSITEYP